MCLLCCMMAAKMKADAKVAASNAETNIAKTVQLDDAFSKPNYVFKDAALSVANMKKLIMAGAPEIAQILKLVTIKEPNRTEDWTIEKNDLDIPVQQATNHYTLIAYKGKDGKCYVQDLIQFLKVYQGGGSYGKVILAPLLKSPANYLIACENIK